MVAQTIELPNVRKLFKPDPGMTAIEVDLARADAQIIAWEADDEPLKALFRSNADIHTSNALDIFGGPGPIKKGAPGYAVWDYKRHRAKRGVHAVNYVCKAKTLAEHIQCSTADAQAFINSWFAAHPKILALHKRVFNDLLLRCCVENVWGYKRHYFELLGLPDHRLMRDTELMLPEAIAWIGQSAVAIAINHILLRLEDTFQDTIQMLLQVHDSVLFQAPTCELDAIIPAAHRAAHMPIPYKDPLIIPPTMAISDRSWGDVRDVIVSGNEWSYKEAA